MGETLKGIRRTHGTAQPGKRALLTADLLQVLAHLDTGLLGCRDRALLLTGFSGGLRRSELAALDLEDVTWVAEGAVLTLRRSKTDQQGRGRQVAIPRGSHPATCPIAALKAWLEAARITSGPLFRAVDRHGRAGVDGLHADSVGTIIKRAVSRAGFEAEGFAGHSLRAGFATQAARNGATVFDIMRQTGHRSVQTVARYVREAQIFHDSRGSKARALSGAFAGSGRSGADRDRPNSTTFVILESRITNVYHTVMLRPFDIAVLLKLTLPGAADSSFQKLASDLHVASSEVHGAVKRARISGLMQHDGPKKVNRSALLELLGHGMRYVYPPVRGELTRGVATSFAAEPLRSFIHDSGAEVPVWPLCFGKGAGVLL